MQLGDTNIKEAWGKEANAWTGMVTGTGKLLVMTLILEEATISATFICNKNFNMNSKHNSTGFEPCLNQHIGSTTNFISTCFFLSISQYHLDPTAQIPTNLKNPIICIQVAGFRP